MRSLNITESMDLDDHRRGMIRHKEVWAWLDCHVSDIPKDRRCPICALAVKNGIVPGGDVCEIEIKRVRPWTDTDGAEYRTCLCPGCNEAMDTENDILDRD